MAQDDKAEFEGLTQPTLGHYQGRAELFWEGTRDHDVTQNYRALLDHIEGEAPFDILDFGCGPGRDLAWFRSQGHLPVGLDGTPDFVAMGQAHSQCPVWQQDFVALDLPPERFDGIFANASLFHIPRQALPRVLGELRLTLRPGGILFCSNPRGPNFERVSEDGRYGCYMDRPEWTEHFIAAGFAERLVYYRPEGQPRDQQPWLAMVWQRV